jgi:hypothetical protein
MHHRLAALVLLVATIPGLVVAQITSDQWNEIDLLHERDRHAEVLSILEALEGLYAGELSESNAMERLAQTQATADEAARIANGSAPAQAHFWRGAARAKQGELRGVLNALFMADDLREDLRLSAEADPEYSNPYYVAGQLYQRLPGFPISFGDGDAAVSFSRRAVDLHEAAYSAGEVPLRYWDYYVRLAENLDSRGWSQRRRERLIANMSDDYSTAETPFERAMYYEAVADIPDQSDAAEAAELLNFVIESLESQDELSLRDERTLSDARELAQ